MKTHDTNGRPYAKLSELKAGDIVELDDGFACARGRKVLKDTPNGLAFDCAEGEHIVSGQADDVEYCIGVYRVPVIGGDNERAV